MKQTVKVNELFSPAVLASQVLCDYDDWFVSQSFFIQIDRLWGPHTIDSFANSCNTKLTRFNSLFWCPGTEAVDAFSHDWSANNNWLVPPIFLIASVIKYMIASKGQGTLIGPCWPMLPSGLYFIKPSTKDIRM